MNTQELQHFDRDQFLQRMDGDEEDACFILEHTKDTIENIISDFQNAMASADLARIQGAAHKIKGTSRSLTFEVLAEKALMLEKTAAAAKESDADEMNSFYDEMSKLAGEIVEEFYYVKTLI